MPAPAAPDYPSVRIKNADGTAYRDFSFGNDLGADLLQTANCGPLLVGEIVGARWDLTIVPGSINIGAKTCDIRRKARSTTDPTKFLTTHPDHDTVVTGVLLDGLTAYYGSVVPDWQLVFQDVAVGIVDTHTAHVTSGDYLGAFEDGNPSAGTPGEAVYEEKLRLVNEGLTIAKQVTAYCNRPRILMRHISGDGIFESVRVTNTDPVEKVVGDELKAYKALWSAPAGGGDGDLTIDGALIASVIRMSNNAPSNSAGLLRGERYRFEDGGLSGVLVKIGSGTYDIGATAGARDNLTIWPPDFTEISADSGGVAVAYGDADVVVGDLAPAAFGYVWLRAFANVGSGAWNPVPVGFGVTYLETGAVDLDEV